MDYHILFLCFFLVFVDNQHYRQPYLLNLEILILDLYSDTLAMYVG